MAFPKRLSALGDSCCGCGACAATCSKGAITMFADDWGFLHPRTNELKCVACGACEKACPALTEHSRDRAEDVWWAKARDVMLKERSSSGGVFGLLACEVLAEGGIVVGAAFVDECRAVRHIIVEDVTELDTIMRSKYVQSSVDLGVYKGVKLALSSGRRVLFSGTACQVAGMRGYLGKLAGSPLLLFVDVVCHGVPSPKLWKYWVEHLNACERARIGSVNFRSKATGWMSYSVLYEYEDEEDNARYRSTEFYSDWYMKAFLNNASLRSSCFSCPSKRACGSDITLGDFWGFQNIHPEIDYEKGVSAVIGNSNKGINALHSITSKLDLGESSIEEILPGNPSFLESVVPYSHRDNFMTDLAQSKGDIRELIEKWTFEPSLSQRFLAILGACRRRFREVFNI